MAEAVKLVHGQYFRLASWQYDTCYGSIFSVAGYYRENYADEAKVAEGIARAVRLGHDLVSSVYSGSILTTSKEFYRREAQRAEMAVVLEEGQTVELEGETYVVTVARGNLRNPVNSNPIGFKKV